MVFGNFNYFGKTLGIKKSNFEKNKDKQTFDYQPENV
jgi:hypothetical protein